MAVNGYVAGRVRFRLVDPTKYPSADFKQNHVANNPIPVSNLRDLIATVHGAVAGLSNGVAAAPELVPATDPKKSVRADYIVCLEDGKRFKSLKRHLMTHYQLTPEAYREKWGLPRDYPMVI